MVSCAFVVVPCLSSRKLVCGAIRPSRSRLEQNNMCLPSSPVTSTSNKNMRCPLPLPPRNPSTLCHHLPERPVIAREPPAVPSYSSLPVEMKRHQERAVHFPSPPMESSSTWIVPIKFPALPSWHGLPLVIKRSLARQARLSKVEKIQNCTCVDQANARWRQHYLADENAFSNVRRKVQFDSSFELPEEMSSKDRSSCLFQPLR